MTLGYGTTDALEWRDMRSDETLAELFRRDITRRPHSSSAGHRAGHLGNAGRKHGCDPDIAETRSGCGLRRHHLLLEGHGAAARVPDRQQPDTLRLYLLRPPAGADGVGRAASDRQDGVLRQRHRLVGGAAGRHWRHRRRRWQRRQVPVPAARRQGAPPDGYFVVPSETASSTSACARSPSARGRSRTPSPTASC